MVSSMDALGAWLRARAGNDVTMTFEEIERVTGAALPPEAQHSSAWWSNLAPAWRAAGFESAEVDLEGRKLVFQRTPGMADEAVEYKDAEPEEKPTRHPAWGAMKGTFWIDPDWDLTNPMYTDEEWAEIEKEWEANWDRLMQSKPRD